MFSIFTTALINLAKYDKFSLDYIAFVFRSIVWFEVHSYKPFKLKHFLKIYLYWHAFSVVMTYTKRKTQEAILKNTYQTKQIHILRFGFLSNASGRSRAFFSSETAYFVREQMHAKLNYKFLLRNFDKLNLIQIKRPRDSDRVNIAAWSPLLTT